MHRRGTEKRITPAEHAKYSYQSSSDKSYGKQTTPAGYNEYLYQSPSDKFCEKRLTPAEHSAYLYQSSSEKFFADYGSLYPCSQSELDFHRQCRLSSKNKGPFVSLLEAITEVMVQNDERRRPSIAEIDAISNLANVVGDRTYRYHPDLVIKAFNDLDTVFFGGRLRGNVIVSWANSMECAAIERDIGKFFGCTESRSPEEKGQARIYLNARGMFLENFQDENPLRAMFCTLLHEMVHAYEWVRCQKHARRRNCHDEYFSTSIDAVHKRALRILGIRAISRGETYQQEFQFKNTVDDSIINQSRGTHGSSRHDDRYTHNHGYESHSKGRRDERSRNRNGVKGTSRGEVGCSVM